MKLTFYMFEKNVKNFDDLIKEEKTKGTAPYKELKPKKELTEYNFDFRVYLQQNKPSDVKWYDLLVEDFDIGKVDEFNNIYNSFVILVKIVDNAEDFFFAITAGYGHTAIEKDKTVPRFGLQTSLNIVEPTQIKAVDARTLSIKAKQTKVLYNQGGAIDEFGVDLNKQLVNEITGKLRSTSTIGTKIWGADSLGLNNKDFTFDKIGDICRQLLTLYNSNEYKTRYSFVDKLSPLKRKKKKSDLEKLLVENINNRNVDHFSVTYPDIELYTTCSHIEMNFKKRKYEGDEITIDSVFEMIKGHKFEKIDQLKRVSIKCELEDGNNVNYSLLDFLVFEVIRTNNTYIYTSRQWFALSNDYRKEVDAEISSLPKLEPKDYLLSWKKGDDEEAYNNSMASQKFLVMDRDLYRPKDGGSPIEICDLFSEDKYFIHVKKYTSSSTINHLMTQGYVSAESIRNDFEFRKESFDRIKSHFSTMALDPQDFKIEEFTIVFAIAKKKDVPSTLPFLCQVQIIETFKSIKRLGIPAKLYQIELE